jgi:hypothetical protein
MPDLARRGFLVGGLALLATPAIVRASSLMPVRALYDTVDVSFQSGTAVTILPSLRGLAVGDVITFQGLKAHRRWPWLERQPELRHFVVTATVPSGGTVVPLYPPIVDSSDSHYQTTEGLAMRGMKIKRVQAWTKADD